MTPKLITLLVAASFAVMAPAVYAHHQKGHTGGGGNCDPKLGCSGQGLAVGQDPKLLATTRMSNAGAGNGGEFVKCDKKGCEKETDVDPGNSGIHNESPECDFIKCEIVK